MGCARVNPQRDAPGHRLATAYIAGDMRLVLDTNVILTAFRSRSGASAELLRRARRGRAQLLASVPLFVEYEAVLMRQEQRDASGLTEAEVGLVLDALAALIEPVETFFLWRPQLRDENDDMVLEAAVNGRADALVTYNERDFLPAAARFGLQLARPPQILERLSS
jgi:putative PIN family toxin of toxin-antitoxin system